MPQSTVPLRLLQLLPHDAFRPGRTHWAEDGAALCQGRTGAEGARTHGLNLSVCITEATPENGLWVVPGSQKRWRLAPWPGRGRADDGTALTEGAFPHISNWLPDAVPVEMEPGDIMVRRWPALARHCPSDRSSVPMSVRSSVCHPFVVHPSVCPSIRSLTERF